jgi:ribonuclease BN (tRNA processing enzyme)
VILRFLGTHNAESRNTRLVSFLIDEVLAVDAGSLVSELTFLEQTKIKAILLSHGHYDHIKAIPAFAFNNSGRSTKIFATSQTLQILSTHLIDGVVYPEFTSEDSFLGKATLQLIPMEPFNRQNIEGYEVMAIPMRHPLDAVGFEITSMDGKRIFKRELIEFRRIKGYLPEIFIIHMSPQCELEIREEVGQVAKELEVSITITHEGKELVL